MNQGSNAKDHFIKQRRNLFAVSLFVIFYKSADFIIKEINIIGNRAEIGNPDIISISLTIAFLYFLWRYYTACREVSGIQQFITACAGWAEAKCKKRVFNKYIKNKARQYTGVDLIERKNLTLTFIIRGTYDPSNDTVEEEKVHIKWLYRLYLPLSIIPITLQTSNFTEYVLPYILAFLAILEFTEFGIVSHLFL